MVSLLDGAKEIEWLEDGAGGEAGREQGRGLGECDWGGGIGRLLAS